jgi:hypothetical protein
VAHTVIEVNGAMKTLPLFPRTLLLAGLGLSLPSLAGSWSGTLPDGSQLRVDPDTRRAVRDQGGAARPMWDGVHRLDDGSVVIIRDGTAVPTRQMMETWQGGPEAAAAQPGGECERLVQRVCGPDDGCAKAAPCASARKLRDAAAGTTGAGQDACIQALSDPAYPVCAAVAPGARATDCSRLVERVCGADGRCDKSPACDPARQLLGMESEERTGDPKALTATGDQCRQAMTNPFFKPCP